MVWKSCPQHPVGGVSLLLALSAPLTYLAYAPRLCCHFCWRVTHANPICLLALRWWVGGKTKLAYLLKQYYNDDSWVQVQWARSCDRNQISWSSRQLQWCWVAGLEISPFVPVFFFFFFFLKFFALASYLVLPCSPKAFPLIAQPNRITTVISK